MSYKLSRNIKQYYGKNYSTTAQGYIGRELRRLTFGEYIDTKEIMRIFKVKDRAYAGEIRRQLGLKHLSSKTIQLYRYYVDGLPVKVIAERLNISVRNVYDRLKKVRDKTGYRTYPKNTKNPDS